MGELVCDAVLFVGSGDGDMEDDKGEVGLLFFCYEILSLPWCGVHKP